MSEKSSLFLHNSKVKYLNHNNDNMDKPGDISPTEKISMYKVQEWRLL